MKNFKTISLLIIYILSDIFGLIIANAVECRPTWNGNWTTTVDCDWPTGKRVYGDIYVQNHTITIGAGRTMGINLATNKITFTGGINSKILLSPTSLINSSITNRYYVAIPFTATSGPTSCPAGMHAFYQTTAPTVTTGYRMMLDTPTVDGGATSKYHNINKVNGTDINPAPGATGTLYCGAR